MRPNCSVRPRHSDPHHRYGRRCSTLGNGNSTRIAWAFASVEGVELLGSVTPEIHPGENIHEDASHESHQTVFPPFGSGPRRPYLAQYSGSSRDPAKAHAIALVKSHPSAASRPKAPNVLTYHNDTSRTGANLNETILTPQNVNASDFGKLFSYDLDGQVYAAQPLEVSNLRIDGKLHNVLFVATENDSVYALDADNPTAGPHHNGVLWHTSFINPATKGITPVPTNRTYQNNGVGPTYGITGTPVIDLATKTIYVVSQEKMQPNNAGGQHYVQEFSAPEYPHRQGEDGHDQATRRSSPSGSFINNTKIAVAGTGSGRTTGWSGLTASCGSSPESAWCST